MPPMTSFEFGDIALVPFPFTDQSTAKKRPAVIISSKTYNAARRHYHGRHKSVWSLGNAATPMAARARKAKGSPRLACLFA